MGRPHHEPANLPFPVSLTHLEPPFLTPYHTFFRTQAAGFSEASFLVLLFAAWKLFLQAVLVPQLCFLPGAREQSSGRRNSVELYQIPRRRLLCPKPPPVRSLLARNSGNRTPPGLGTTVGDRFANCASPCRRRLLREPPHGEPRPQDALPRASTPPRLPPRGQPVRPVALAARHTAARSWEVQPGRLITNADGSEYYVSTRLQTRGG